ncbi:hypothetical protein MBLNU13_g06133t1 [Cladosporium sp. NU13]
MEGNPSAAAAAGASDPPPAKRRKFDYDLTKTFDVLVGKEPNQQRFTVYHDILTRCSKFLQAARSGRWATQPDQATVLDDHEPEVFSTLTSGKWRQWISKQVPCGSLIRVSETRNEYPGPRLISYVYGSTTTGSPLRRLCRDWYLFTVDESWVDTLHHDSYPHAFMKDLVYETYDLQCNNQRKQVHKIFAAEKLADRRTMKYYHQKVDKDPDATTMPQHHHRED